MYSRFFEFGGVYWVQIFLGLITLEIGLLIVLEAAEFEHEWMRISGFGFGLFSKWVWSYVNESIEFSVGLKCVWLQENARKSEKILTIFLKFFKSYNC